MNKKTLITIVCLLLIVIGCKSIQKSIHFSADHPANSSNTNLNASDSRNYMQEDDLEINANEQLKDAPKMPEGSHHHEGSHH